ncbi:MAG: molybdopterin-guanine dinucleotide biosynthesis protein B [Magnetococcales bacterium]|nr:molybdopterin-guanine dinucleotide biosynthesis protein B [Magnetococcales bacterium]
MSYSTPLLGFTAPSGTGKTTLMEGVIAQLTRSGLCVAAIKHGHHPADPDIPGKDTYRFRQAGAETVMFASKERWFMIQELKNRPEPNLAEQIERLKEHDLILVEGYKNDDHPKIVLHRRGRSDPLFYQQLTNVVALASDDPKLEVKLPLLPLGDPVSVARFIQERLGLSGG